MSKADNYFGRHKGYLNATLQNEQRSHEDGKQKN